jgi:hypothetical protein
MEPLTGHQLIWPLQLLLSKVILQAIVFVRGHCSSSHLIDIEVDDLMLFGNWKLVLSVVNYTAGAVEALHCPMHYFRDDFFPSLVFLNPVGLQSPESVMVVGRAQQARHCFSLPVKAPSRRPAAASSSKSASTASCTTPTNDGNKQATMSQRSINSPTLW